MPNVTGVVEDGAIGREEAHPCGVQDRHSSPVLLIEIGVAYGILAIDIRLIVSEQQVLILIQQRVDDRAEQLLVPPEKTPDEIWSMVSLRTQLES